MSLKGESNRSVGPEFDSYFDAKYGQTPEREFYYKRLAAALTYLIRHQEELNTGKVSVLGEKEALISVYLMDALYRIYAQCPDNFLREDFDVSMVLEFAKESMEMRNKPETEM